MKDNRKSCITGTANPTKTARADLAQHQQFILLAIKKNNNDNSNKLNGKSTVSTYCKYIFVNTNNEEQQHAHVLYLNIQCTVQKVYLHEAGKAKSKYSPCLPCMT
jgi:hypothetical protein